MSLKGYADAVLANVVTVWAANNVILPDLQYVAEGPFSSVSMDCEQVVVSIDQVVRGRPGEPNPGYTPVGMEWSATVTVLIVRLCMATSGDEAPAAAADHDAAAATTLGDVDLLWRNVKTIFDANGCRHSGVVLGGPLEVAGGAGGAKLSTTIDMMTI